MSLGSATPLLASLLLISCSRVPELKPLAAADSLPAAARQQLQAAYGKAQANPKDAAANQRLGMLLQVYNRMEAAEVAYRRALASQPSSFDLLYYRAVVLTKAHQDGPAAEAYRQALAVKPDDLNAQMGLAKAFTLTGRTAEAQQLYRTVPRGSIAAAEASFELGAMLQTLGLDAAALEHLEEACRLVPDYAAAHYAAAASYRKLSQTAKSAEHLAAYKASPNTAPIRPDPLLDAVEDLDESPSGLTRRAGRAETAGNHQEAAQLFDRALAAAPNNFDAHLGLVWVSGKLMDFARGERHYQAAASIDASSARLEVYYSALLFEQGKFAEAERHGRRALEMNPDLIEAQSNLCLYQDAVGRLAEAAACYQKVIERKPTDTAPRLSRAKLLFRLGQARAAEALLLGTINPMEFRPPLLIACARVFREVGQAQLGRAFYAKVRPMGLLGSGDDQNFQARYFQELGQ